MDWNVFVSGDIANFIRGIEGNKAEFGLEEELRSAADEAERLDILLSKGRDFISRDIVGENTFNGIPGINAMRVIPGLWGFPFNNMAQAAYEKYGMWSSAIMAGNSDLFKAAKDMTENYVGTHAATTADELEKWVEMSQYFTYNLADAEDIQEKIFALTRDIANEMNEESAAYLEERAYFNDYAEKGDDPIAAFNRVRARNYADFQNGIISWQEYSDTVSEIGSTMYKARIEQSYGWLEQERKYNDLSAEDYIAGLERMKAYSDEYYKNGIISYREFYENIREIDNAIADEQESARRSVYEEWLRSSENWYKQRSAYDDWEDYGDSPVKFYERCIERMDEMFKAGNISWEEYIDGTIDYSIEKYNAQMDEVDDMLEAQKAHIERAKAEFENERDALELKWKTEDRREDMTEVMYQLSIYRNAVTDRGQAKYKELQEQLKKLRREEELYELEKSSNAVITRLREEYELMERNKKATLAAIEDANIDVRGVVESINSEVEGVQDVIRSIAASIINAINSNRTEAATYSDSRTINITAADGVLINSLISRGGAAMARGAYY